MRHLALNIATDNCSKVPTKARMSGKFRKNSGVSSFVSYPGNVLDKQWDIGGLEGLNVGPCVPKNGPHALLERVQAFKHLFSPEVESEAGHWWQGLLPLATFQI